MQMNFICLTQVVNTWMEQPISQGLLTSEAKLLQISNAKRTHACFWELWRLSKLFGLLTQPFLEQTWISWLEGTSGLWVWITNMALATELVLTSTCTKVLKASAEPTAANCKKVCASQTSQASTRMESSESELRMSSSAENTQFTQTIIVGRT